MRRRDEPTLTKTLRKSYSAEFYNRYRNLKGILRESVATNDALRLGSPQQQIASRLASPVDDFQAEQNAEKKEAFMRWFRNAQRNGVLEPLSEGRVRRGEHWTAKYVRGSYTNGIKMSEEALKRLPEDVPVEMVSASGQTSQAGTVSPNWNMPIHQDSLELLYTRHYEALEGITSAVDKEISRVLTDGFLAGRGPRRMATTLNDRVDSIGLTRARTLARTETLRTANTAALNRYEQSDIKKVEVLVANDDRTCNICAPKDGNVLSLKEARGDAGPIFHVNCRCSTAPYVG